MILTREVRCWSGDRNSHKNVRQPPLNTWAGGEGGDADAAFWVLRIAVEGSVDPATGYVCDLRRIDDWTRERLAAALRDHLRRSAGSPEVGACLSAAAEAASRFLPPSMHPIFIEWFLSPYTRYTVVMSEPHTVLLTRAYEFSAAHRLGCADYSEAENQRIFGKCSNPHGHGHNYLLEVTIRGTPNASTGRLIPLAEMDRIVHERVVEPFDHKNLNLECPEFAQLNPSVENIARVIFDRLKPAFDGTRLTKVQVWETPKTSATCTAEDS